LADYQITREQVHAMRDELQRRGVRIERLGLDNPGSGAGREETFSRDYSDHAEERRALCRLLTDPASARDDNYYSSVLKRASLSTQSGAVGGYLVPTFVQSLIVQDTLGFDTVRNAGAQFMTVRGKENVPVINDPTAVYQSEAAAIAGMTAADPTFGEVQVRPTLLSANTAYSWHVQNFSEVDVEQEIIRSFGRAIRKAAAKKYLVGGGTDEPQGIVAGAGTGVTCAAQTTFTAAEVDTLWGSLSPEFQQSAIWVVSPTAATILRSLESSAGFPLWMQTLAQGFQTLYGRPVVIDSNMDAVAATKKPILLASVPDAYVIAESTIYLVVDPYTLATNAQNRVIAYQFSDGRVKKASAAKAMAMAT
jgi:HK97 family phage major capsid protein